MILRVGTRRSPLARVQTQLVCELLRAVEPGLCVETVPLETSGDRVRDRPLRESGCSREKHPEQRTNPNQIPEESPGFGRGRPRLHDDLL